MNATDIGRIPIVLGLVTIFLGTIVYTVGPSVLLSVLLTLASNILLVILRK